MRVVTHSYDSYDQAARVVDALERAGVPRDDITVISGDKSRTATTTDAAADTSSGAGTGATVGAALGGGAGLLAGLGSLAIPGVGPLVAAGWLVATLTGAGVGAAAGGLAGALTGAGIDEADARHYAEHIGRGGTLVSVRAPDEHASRVESMLEHGDVGMGGAGDQTRAAAFSTGQTAPSTTAGMGGDKIEVIKEELSVGKRQVEGGGVRVTSHVVERPVEETVNLHEERVSVERRPVNYPLTGAAADAFRERTIEARATTEEAVVSKEARVVEEIGLRKEAADRVETVRNTVRETKVEVEQEPGGTAPVGRGVGATGHVTGAAGTARAAGGDLRDNSVTRAADDTFGTNMSGERPDQADGTPGNPPGTMVSRGVDKTLGTNVSGANPAHESLGTGPSTSRTETARGDVADNSVTRAADDALGTNMSGERPDQSDGTPANPKGTMVSRGVDKTLGTNVSGTNPGHKVG